MKLFLDTANIDEIKALKDTGFVDGVTTNPSLIAKSGHDLMDTIAEICELVSGPVSAEVTATDADTMLKEGLKLAAIADNVAVKVPLTWDGLKAAAKHEEAFKQELMVVVPLSIAAWFIPVSLPERALLFSTLQLILIVELINSAIEANTDHISMERHPLAKRAKDMGSAAVFLTIVIALSVWGTVLWQRFA